MWRRAIIWLGIILASIFLGFLIADYLNERAGAAAPVSSEPVIRYITLPAEYIEVEVPVIDYRYSSIFPREFKSVDHFKQWYTEQDFRVYFTNGDCDDYAGDLQRVALMQGYSISQALILNGIYFGKQVTHELGGHAGNMVLIDGTYYFVEPQPDKFKVIKICDRD